MKIGVPQIIMLATLAINLGINMKNHKEPHLEHYNGWVMLFATAINITLLWWGGFFG